MFYFGMVNTKAYIASIGAEAFVGAGACKMASVVSALRLAGRRAILVSLPFVGTGVRADFFLVRVIHGDGFPSVFLPARRSPALRKVFGIFAMAWFALRGVRSGDTVLFYNHAVEYLLALLVLRLRGVVVFQDIEDVPCNEDIGFRGLLNRLGYGLMFLLSAPCKVTASNQIGRALGLTQFFAVQGIAAGRATKISTGKWVQLAAGGPLRVHFGGTLIPSTGLDLFWATVKRLKQLGAADVRAIEFFVTGLDGSHRVQNIASCLSTDNLRVNVYPSVDRAAYLALLDSCHAGLSLRNPDAEISNTTFPSKVIEIASHGLALVTTKVSDVGDIFSDAEAWLLPDYTAGALAGVLRYMAGNPAEVRQRAAAGQALVHSRFAPLAVGRALAAFLEAGPRGR